MNPIIPPTREEMAAHLRSGWDGKTCLVCGDMEPSFSWTDYNGQLYCHQCGSTYQINGCRLSPESLTLLGLQNERVATRYCDMFEVSPVARAYWEERHEWYPWGMWIGNPPKQYDPAAFGKWLAANTDSIRPAYEGNFHWDRILAAKDPGEFEVIE